MASYDYLTGKLNSIKTAANLHFLNKFGFCVDQSSFKLYGDKEWDKFCKDRVKLAEDVKHVGLYSADDMVANILASYSLVDQTFLHEYFGHGLYYEHSFTGKRIASLAKKRRNPEEHLELKALCFGSINNNEGFAIWASQMLSHVLGDSDGALGDLECMRLCDRELLVKAIDYTEKYTDYGFIYKSGFPKHYNKNILEAIIRKAYGTGSVSLAVCNGSHAPYSDISLLVVSDELESENLGWLDMTVMSHKEFSDGAKYLDLAVVDALTTGFLVHGSDSRFRQLKDGIFNSSISYGMIDYSWSRARETRGKAVSLPNAERQKALSRASCYEYAAKALSRGRKLFSWAEAESASDL